METLETYPPSRPIDKGLIGLFSLFLKNQAHRYDRGNLVFVDKLIQW